MKGEIGKFATEEITVLEAVNRSILISPEEERSKQFNNKQWREKVLVCSVLAQLDDGSEQRTFRTFFYKQRFVICSQQYEEIVYR